MTVSSLILLAFRSVLIAVLTICCTSICVYSQNPSANSIITLSPPSPGLNPGDMKQITASLMNGAVPVATVDNTKFAWKLADQTHVAHIQILPVNNQLTVVGLNSPAGVIRPPSIPVIVTYIDAAIPVNLSGVLNVALTLPTVTATWDVLPKNVCKHSFGSSVGNDFYCIEVTIANHSGFDLQLADVSFKLQGAAPAGTPPAGPTVSSTGYNVVRNTVQRRNMFYPRSMVLSIITALGPVLTGFTPYFHNVNHRGNFTEGINILSNPLEKGLEKAWPDPTGRYLDNLNGIVLREGVIIPNNSLPMKTRVFYPKKNLVVPKADRDNPVKVREALGNLNLDGTAVQYVNSIRVTTP